MASLLLIVIRATEFYMGFMSNPSSVSSLCGSTEIIDIKGGIKIQVFAIPRFLQKCANLSNKIPLTFSQQRLA